jgi:hypothetical protein
MENPFQKNSITSLESYPLLIYFTSETGKTKSGDQLMTTCPNFGKITLSREQNKTPKEPR